MRQTDAAVDVLGTKARGVAEVPLRLARLAQRLEDLCEIDVIAGVLRFERDSLFEKLARRSDLPAQQGGNPQHIHAAMMSRVRLQYCPAGELRVIQPTRPQGADRLFERHSPSINATRLVPCRCDRCL